MLADERDFLKDFISCCELLAAAQSDQLVQDSCADSSVVSDITRRVWSRGNTWYQTRIGPRLEALVPS